MRLGSNETRVIRCWLLPLWCGDENEPQKDSEDNNPQANGPLISHWRSNDQMRQSGHTTLPQIDPDDLSNYFAGTTASTTSILSRWEKMFLHTTRPNLAWRRPVCQDTRMAGTCAPAGILESLDAPSVLHALPLHLHACSSSCRCAIPSFHSCVPLLPLLPSCVPLHHFMRAAPCA